MSTSFDFDQMFILDLANNHQGRVEHGLEVIRHHGAVVKKHGVRAVMKFQFRQLDSFVHPDHQDGSDNKHIPRFLATRLSLEDYQVLLDEVRAQGMLAMCTPFDEESVDIIADMGFDILKIASCSVADWPLLEKAVDSSLPMVVSTGGLDIAGIDALQSFLTHHGVDFAIMHCVSIYPTPDDRLYLDKINLMRRRYPGTPIGWSTHETPSDTTPVQMAVSKGAVLFERHVGWPTKNNKLNLYSSNPEEIDAWITAYKRARALCREPEVAADDVEVTALSELQRGIFAKRPLKVGKTVERGDVYFAMPWQDGQVPSGDWRPGIKVTSPIEVGGPLYMDGVDTPPSPPDLMLKHSIHEVKALLNMAGVALNSDFITEYSHHHGMGGFRDTGAVIITCIDRDYCKKLIVQLPGQNHPEHFHKLKEETFQVLYGVLKARVDGCDRVLWPGEMALIQPGVWHSFGTETGVVFEEVSTRDHNSDSYYREKAINRMAREDRKTTVDHWGRFQLREHVTGE